MLAAPETVACATAVVAARGGVVVASRLTFGGEAYTPNDPAPFADEPQVTKDRPRALVVDDAPDVTEMLAILLQYAGYEVVTVYSGPQALNAARAEKFDVVVSDIGMPGMNGYELAEAVRALPDYQTTPMIAVTGFTMYEDRDRALHSGFNAFLTKPINPRDLINLVERLRS
jgi:CheY-like chemotaxis protein